MFSKYSERQNTVHSGNLKTDIPEDTKQRKIGKQSFDLPSRRIRAFQETIEMVGKLMKVLIERCFF